MILKKHKIIIFKISGIFLNLHFKNILFLNCLKKYKRGNKDVEKKKKKKSVGIKGGKRFLFFIF
jgi:hypothetical protein